MQTLSHKEQAMSGWNVWARSRDDEARWPAGPWGSATLREARVRADREAAQCRKCEAATATSGFAVGKNAPQTPMLPSRGACGGDEKRTHDLQLVAAEELAANEAPCALVEMHHATAAGANADAPPAARSARPRVTDDEIARVHTYVECGYSLRQAAAAVGRYHASVLRCIRRRPEWLVAYRQKRELAREQPLRQLHEASQRSWRAAAWLLTYFDRRESARRAQQTVSLSKGKHD